MTDEHEPLHDPLHDAGARLRGAVDPAAFDPDWDGRARARRRSRATVVGSAAVVLGLVVGGAAAATGDDGDDDGGQVVATAPDTSPGTVPTPAPDTTSPPTMTTVEASSTTTEDTAVEPATSAPSGDTVVVIGGDGPLGWWDGRAWQDVDATSPDIPVAPGAAFTVAGVGRATSTAIGGPVEPFTCTPYEDWYTVSLDPPLEVESRVPNAIAVNAVWEVVARDVTALDPANPTYVDAAAAIVADLGVPGAPAHLDQVVRTDLDGDGVEEVVLVGRHPDADTVSSPRAGWYAFVALRSVVDGEVRTDVLADAVYLEDDDNYPSMTILHLDAVGDLNGDGTMELVYGESMFESSSTYVLEWTGPGDEPEVVLAAGCGV